MTEMIITTRTQDDLNPIRNSSTLVWQCVVHIFRNMATLISCLRIRMVSFLRWWSRLDMPWQSHWSEWLKQ